MYFTLGDVIALFALSMLCLHVFGAVRVRELAVQAVMRTSKRDDFQLLDQSVHIQRMSMSRDETRRWRIWRQYRFDYSFDGVERRQGFVIMLGKQLQSVTTKRGKLIAAAETKRNKVENEIAAAGQNAIKEAAQIVAKAAKAIAKIGSETERAEVRSLPLPRAAHRPVPASRPRRKPRKPRMQRTTTS